eukprot:NODE_265_length_11346_cov_0.635814.p12 type:complete len:111 gc:universal NODE_265_length_11346_cov_0.635814:8012-8344(+)
MLMILMAMTIAFDAKIMKGDIEFITLIDKTPLESKLENKSWECSAVVNRRPFVVENCDVKMSYKQVIELILEYKSETNRVLIGTEVISYETYKDVLKAMNEQNELDLGYW